VNLRSSALIALVCASVAVLSAQPAVPDFSGTWQIDDARSGRGVDVWGQTRARLLVITQTASEIVVATDGGGPSAPGDLRFRIGGGELLMRDDSLGELPNFVRRVRTFAAWSGDALKTETETITESIDERSGAPKVSRGITSVLTFHLSADGTTLTVERTGFRAQPPAMLLGRAYDRTTDLAYNVDRVRYVRAERQP
jgi:hypothetical protein